MIPTDEQAFVIRRYLDKHLKYRETNAEMFDHILTALEHVLAQLSFGDAMNKVIDDIGGLKGLAMIETANRAANIRAILVRYIQTLKQICKSPFIIVATVCTLIIFWLNNYFLLSQFFWISSFSLMVNLPSFVIKRKILCKANLVNVKNDASKRLYLVSSMVIPGIMLLSVLVLKFGTKNLFQDTMPYICTAAFFTAILHAAVLYKLSRKEFRVNYPIVTFNTDL
jgi:hypothetical protein